MSTILALASTAGLDAAAVARGKLLFEDTGLACATCHAGALLTNNATVDVGTGLPVQVPIPARRILAGALHAQRLRADARRPIHLGVRRRRQHGVTSTLTNTQSATSPATCSRCSLGGC